MYGKAFELRAMKIWKLPKDKGHMREVVCGNGKYFGQVKKDGYWYEAEIDDDGNAFLFARDESTKTPGHLTEKSSHVPHIMKEITSMFPKGTIVIGEVYYPQVGKTSKDVGQIMGAYPVKAISRQESEYGYLHYYIHDIIRYAGNTLLDWNNEERWNFLKGEYHEYCNDHDIRYINLAEELDCNNMSEQIDDIIINRGGEGVVLKLKTGKYVPGKRPAWNMIKFKCEDEANVVCIGYDLPTKEYTGTEPLENWKFWMKEDTGYDPGNKMVTPSEMSIAPCAEAIQYGYIPVSKPYWHGWIGAIKIGIYNDLGYLVPIKNSNGSDATVWSGLNEETLEAIKNDPHKFRNKSLTVSCMQIYEDGTLRHPVFEKWRDDLHGPTYCTFARLIG